MANTYANYAHVVYAQRALQILMQNLGMGRRVYREYDKELRVAEKGASVAVNKPPVFTAQDSGAAAQDLTPTAVNITLDYHREIKFGITDKEAATVSPRLMEDAIPSALYTLAQDIDTKLGLLYKDVPWTVDLDGTTPGKFSDWPKIFKRLADNNVPMDPSRLFLQMNTLVTQNALSETGFVQQQGAGDEGVQSQISGRLGTKFGIQPYMNQNSPSHTKGTVNDTALQILGTAAAGATTIALDAVDAGVTGTLVAGDILSITGHTQKYAVTAVSTASGNAFAVVTITPGLTAAVVDNQAVTVTAQSSGVNLAYHQNAFALVMAQLPDGGAYAKNADIAIAFDPVTALGLRYRQYYLPDTPKMMAAIDVLYGVKTLDPNLAVRARDTIA
jgi:hypothetical protein